MPLIKLAGRASALSLCASTACAPTPEKEAAQAASERAALPETTESAPPTGA